jgi:hypothetical protein
MIFDASQFIFEPPKEIAFARRVLIKPSAAHAAPHPLTTSRETMAAVIEGIRRISTADIILLEKSAGPDSVHSIYKYLGYDFARTILLDVDQCVPVAVENPLPKPFAVSTFWIPNVILSCDFLITISPFKIIADSGDFSIKNLLGLLPADKYGRNLKGLLTGEGHSNVDSIVADLYFTLPFDLGIVDGRKRYVVEAGDRKENIIDYSKIFVGTPYEVDMEASKAAVSNTGYIELIKKAISEKEKN